MNDELSLAERALDLVEESFIAASGPGGQNVNKVATAVQLRLDVFALRLEPAAFQRLKALAGSRMTAKGEIVLTARKFRTQEANREDARARLAELIEQALVEFRPETGRTHQIRVHAASGLGVALLGDPVYGDGKHAARTMLHAAGLEIAREGKPPIVAAAPMPADFVALGFSDG